MSETTKNAIIWLQVKRTQILEFIRFDSKVCSALLFLAYLTIYYSIKLVRGDLASLHMAGKIFRHTQFDKCRDFAAHKLRKSILKYGATAVGQYFYFAVCSDNHTTSKLRDSVVSNKQPFDSRLIILSVPTDRQKGVILLKFTDNFKYFAKIFDLKNIYEKYVLVLEPSFSGYFNEAILCLMKESNPIIIQASEQVDYRFIESLKANFVPIKIGANCWVDARVFFEIKTIKKEYDLIMVALWADFKRHYHLFKALSKCRNKHKIKVALVGAPWPKLQEDIRALARLYNVEKYIDFFEQISQQDLNVLYNKSKVCVLLSKKEGFNKSIIEAMHANTPAFILKGFNYGENYEYINSNTGGFINPSHLCNFIENIDDIVQQGNYSPAEWVRKNMSFEQTTERLKERLEHIERIFAIQINKNLQHKVNTPDCDYTDVSTWAELAQFYEDLQLFLKNDLS